MSYDKQRPGPSQGSGKRPRNRNGTGPEESVRSQGKSSRNRKEQTQDTAAKEIEQIKYLTNKVVRYIVINGGSNIPIKRPDIVKNLLSGNKHTPTIFKRAKQTLIDVYGYELVSCDSKFIKCFVLKNTLASIEVEEITNDIPKDTDVVLRSLVLCHIFMSGGSSTDISLFCFLKHFKIDPNINHSLFGNIKEFLNVKMIREKYLSMYVTDCTRKVSYSWGQHAENCVSKMEMLKFVSKAFGDKNIKSWSGPYEAALEDVENQHEDNEDDNDEDKEN